MSGCSCEEYDDEECDYCQGFKHGKEKVFSSFEELLKKIIFEEKKK